MSAEPPMTIAELDELRERAEPRPNPEPATPEGRRWHDEEHGRPCPVAACFLAARIRALEAQARLAAIDDIDNRIRATLAEFEGDAARSWTTARRRRRRIV